MPILFIDYANLVVKAYEEKRDANLLSQLLMHPTTVNIRQACLNVYNERIGRGEQPEENTLGAFFGVPPAGKKIGHLMKDHPADKFRPIQSLMRRETKTPNPIYVELLAWLIDFNPRPLAHAQRVIGNTPETEPVSYGTSSIENKPGPEPVVTQAPKTVEEPSNPNIPKTENFPEQGGDKTSIKGNESIDLEEDSKKNKLKIASLIGLVIVFLFGGAYIVRQNLNTDCMYWAGDHYERVPCDEDPKGRIFLPLNEKKMSRFKKITKPDTITAQSIGKIYYISDSNEIEYYTDSGEYPEDLNRNVRKLTRYIFDKDSVNRYPSNP